MDSGDSGLQGFVEGAMHSMGLTHTAGGHAWRGTHSRIILELQGEAKHKSAVRLPLKCK